MPALATFKEEKNTDSALGQLAGSGVNQQAVFRSTCGA